MSKNISFENMEPEFRSTFNPLVDEDGYLVNQGDISCQEVTGKSLLILRTSKDSKKNSKAAKDIFDIKLPETLQITSGDADLKCFWVSPDEFWVSLNTQQMQQTEGKFVKLPSGVSITDS